MNTKNIAIHVEHISKCYRIGLKETVQDSLFHTVLSFIKNPLKNYRRYRSLYNFEDVNPHNDTNPPDIIWAVRDVSFEVKEGEIVGIIGVNGAGKSTLLKILSRITAPTSGQVVIRGRISSLLEVGTGFHPELTGRDNIYLNGTILGMRKKEIDKKFDEIVDFSGVEKFIDTPVKRYSSGMKVRLAFAVAAHLEPEILVIDEVLAVGDARFQKKCLDKMKEVGRHGRTVLFVSHNMPAVTRLCSRTILLNGGRVMADGPSSEVVGAYLNANSSSQAEREWSDSAKAPGDEVVRLCAARIKTKEGQVKEAVDTNKPVGIEVEYEILQPGHVFSIYFHVINQEGIEAFTPFDTDPSWKGRERPEGRYISMAWIPGRFLSEGMYYIGIGIATLYPTVPRIRVKDAVAFQAVDILEDGAAIDDYRGKFNGGVVRPYLEWETRVVRTKTLLERKVGL